MAATAKSAARPMTIVHRGSADTEPTEGPDRCFLDDPTPTAGDAASLCGPADHAILQRVVEEEEPRNARRDRGMPILPAWEWKIPRRDAFARAALLMGTRLGSSHPAINVGR